MEAMVEHSAYLDVVKDRDHYAKLAEELRYDLDKLHGNNYRLKRQLKAYKKEVEDSYGSDAAEVLDRYITLYNRLIDAKKEVDDLARKQRDVKALIAENEALKMAVDDANEVIAMITADQAAIQAKLDTNGDYRARCDELEQSIQYTIYNLTKLIKA